LNGTPHIPRNVSVLSETDAGITCFTAQGKVVRRHATVSGKKGGMPPGIYFVRNADGVISNVVIDGMRDR